MGEVLVSNIMYLVLCSVSAKGEELCGGVSTTPGEEAKRPQHDSG